MNKKGEIFTASVTQTKTILSMDVLWNIYFWIQGSFKEWFTEKNEKKSHVYCP